MRRFQVYSTLPRTDNIKTYLTCHRKGTCFHDFKLQEEKAERSSLVTVVSGLVKESVSAMFLLAVLTVGLPYRHTKDIITW